VLVLVPRGSSRAHDVSEGGPRQLRDNRSLEPPSRPVWLGHVPERQFDRDYRPADLQQPGPERVWRDALGGEWGCTGAGTPGTWMQWRPAAVTTDPARGTIPTGYLLRSVTDGVVKRHAGAYSSPLFAQLTVVAGAGQQFLDRFYGCYSTSRTGHHSKSVFGVCRVRQCWLRSPVPGNGPRTAGA